MWENSRGIKKPARHHGIVEAKRGDSTPRKGVARTENYEQMWGSKKRRRPSATDVGGRESGHHTPSREGSNVRGITSHSFVTGRGAPEKR